MVDFQFCLVLVRESRVKLGHSVVLERVEDLKGLELVLDLWKHQIVCEVSIDVTDGKVLEAKVILKQVFKVLEISHLITGAQDNGEGGFHQWQIGMVGWLDEVMWPRQWEDQLQEGGRHIELEGRLA